ncbi:hypothetical protein ADUPG1_011132, partial [Aduncisulcus paluster]
MKFFHILFLCLTISHIITISCISEEELRSTCESSRIAQSYCTTSFECVSPYSYLDPIFSEWFGGSLAVDIDGSKQDLSTTVCPGYSDQASCCGTSVYNNIRLATLSYKNMIKSFVSTINPDDLDKDVLIQYWTDMQEKGILKSSITPAEFVDILQPFVTKYADTLTLQASDCLEVFFRYQLGLLCSMCDPNYGGASSSTFSIPEELEETSTSSYDGIINVQNGVNVAASTSCGWIDAQK